MQLKYNGELMKDNLILSDYGIEEGDCIVVNEKKAGGGYIDNLKEESKTEKAKKIGFDMDLIKRDELNINLIYFDVNMNKWRKLQIF